MGRTFALQLYSLRDRVEGDFAGQLKKVAAVGYRGVEFAGFHGIPANEMRALLGALSLTPAGSHTPLEQLENDLDAVIAYNRAIGTQAVVIPYAAFETEADVERIVSLSRKIAPSIREAGMRLLYHNHHQEFNTKFDGKPVLELLRDRTAPEELEFELDIYWAAHAGYDPVQVMRDFGSRCVYVHAKDMNNRQEKKMTEVGTGVVDTAGVLAQCDRQGIPWVIVEQDEIEIDEYQSVEISLRNLSRMQ